MTTNELLYRPGSRQSARDVAALIIDQNRTRWVSLTYDAGDSRQVLDRYQLSPGDGSLKKLTNELASWIDQHLRAVDNAPSGRWLTFKLRVTRLSRQQIKGIVRDVVVRYGPPKHTLDFGGEA